jgi:plastocyanin
MTARRGPAALRAGAALLAVTLGVAACSGPAPQRRELHITRFAYAPARMHAREGDTLVVINDDAVPHTATAANHSWDSGSIAAGDSGRVVIGKNGVGDYACTFHPSMKGRLANTD